MTLRGFSGHLVGHSYLVRHLSRGAQPTIDPGLKALAESCAASRTRIGPTSSVRAILENVVGPFLENLGFEGCADLSAAGSALVGTARAGFSPVVVVTAPWGDRLDGYWRTAVAAAQRQSAPWCLLFNGAHVRVVDAGRLYSRRFADFDLAAAVDRTDTLAAIRRVAGSRALAGGRADPLSLHALVTASDRDAASVCRSLREGVLTASAELLSALSSRNGQRDAAFDQSLTIVYRIVFLLFAEARLLVPVWHPVYRESYSVESLREAAERSMPARGVWDALRAIGRLAHAGCHAGDLRVTPFNGRLFAPVRTPLAERRDLDDRAACRAVLALSTRRSADRAGREPVAYADLGVEQLGAVYETLLDYRPAGPPGAPATLERGSGVRKATGTFYTPQAIADFIARRTLGPLVNGRTADEILRLRVVDPAMGSGACLVAACRFLAAAYEQALIAGGDCHASDFGESDRASIRRRVTEGCLYGVDLNPMAVQLARLSLWLTSLAADRPLSFLDHRLASGDSLLGAWLSALRHPPRRRRSASVPRLPLFADDAAAGALQHALPVRFSLDAIPNDTVEQVRAKERALAGLAARAAGLSRWKRVADLWCAIWFDGPEGIPAEAFGALADAVASGGGPLPPRAEAAYLARSQSIASARRFFHWELEFPEAFFDASGRRLERPGFDAVLGNPPWDMMRADSGDTPSRARSRTDVAAAVRFTRHAGLYQAQSHGHPNRYQLFVERALALTRPGGRLGLVLPWGLAADHGSGALRRHLMDRSAIDSVIGIDNHRAIFPIHRSVRFLIVTATAGPPTGRFACRLGLESTSELDAIGDGEDDGASFPVRVSASTLERLSGASLAVPYLKSSADLAILEKATSLFPALGADAGWRARFGRELNATDDRRSFGPPGRGLPVVDGRHLEPFRVAVGASPRSIRASEACRRLGRDRVGRPRLAYRDVASSTNRLTLIAAVLPARAVSTHTLFCLRTPFSLRDQHFLCGLFNSLFVNYLVRLRVTTHVTTAIVEQLPLPLVEAAPAAAREIAAIARRLSRRADRALLARLNALVARLYGLERKEFEHVLETFPLIAVEDRSAALKSFAAIS